MAHTTQVAEVATTALRSPRSFATTNWTLVVDAMDARTEKGRAALEQLCRTYWRPLYAFARHLGVSPSDAEDLTQAFLADLLAQGRLAMADSKRGRFRTFLLTSFRNFHANQRRFARAKKRGGDLRILSLEELKEAESQFQRDTIGAETPEQLFDRNWGQWMLTEAIQTVQGKYAAAGKKAHFLALRDALWSERGEVPYADLARCLKTSEGAVRVALHRLRRRVGDEFRQEIAKTVHSQAEVEDEIRHLLAAVSR